MVRIVFMGTPEFAVPTLQALIDTQDVVGVVTQPDRPAGRGQEMRPSPVKVLAESAGLPLFQPATLRRETDAAPLRRWQPQAIIVAAYGQILRPHLLELPSHGCLNVHASLLPRWRGASPIQHAILAGDERAGITLMQMDEGLDTGPIYVQEAIPIGERETAQTLHDRLAQLGADMVRRYLDDVLAGRLVPKAQVEEQATYAPMIDKEDGRLDWSQSSQDLDRRIRAMTPWPGAFTTWEQRRLKVLAARPWSGELPLNATPGRVVKVGESVIVQAGEGGLYLLEVQLAGKRAMPVADFVRGRPDFVGSRLDQQ